MKVGIRAIASLSIGLAPGGLTTIAVEPLAVAIVTGKVVSMLLDQFDEQYGATKRLSAAIDKYGQEFAE
jgi:hypothetical protein